MKKYLCIHGHFYQPPREDPWTGKLPRIKSASPYHDWNERITAQCYSPNGAAKILDREGHVLKIFNNYSHMSFDFGPTLLSWLEINSPNVYRTIQVADHESRIRFSGHGNALAQAYNHMIMPLANRRDKRTQLVWGMKDFEFRFGRKPEGLWLPETAVDLETLEMMSGLGIRFTVLAPHQAKRFRWMDRGEWIDTDEEPIDPRVPYRLCFPSGDYLILFFYDGVISQKVAFEGLLKNGEAMKNSLLTKFSRGRTWPELVHIATDGETFGHHLRFGEMGLAYVLNALASGKDTALTNYGEYLDRFSPFHEVEIKENTSWSCAHGVERWRSDCGCNVGHHPGWNQAWRVPLRKGFDWLRDTLIPPFETEAGKFFQDPWEARDEILTLWLDATPKVKEDYFNHRGSRPLSPTQRKRLMRMMEMQRHLMYMYTSCGWFFDDPSGMETGLVLGQALRALQMAEEFWGLSLMPTFLDYMGKVRSNLPEVGTAKDLCQKMIAAHSTKKK